MATYSQDCYSIGGYGYAENFTLYVELSEKWIDTNANTSYVDYNVYCQSSGSGSINANHFKYFAIDGDEVLSTTEKVNAYSPDAYIHLCDGTIGPLYHDDNGNRRVAFYAEIEASSYGVGASIEETFNLSQIPRYTTVYNSEREKGLTSISVNWSTTDARDWTQYSLNDGNWKDAYDSVSSDNKSGYYIVNGLQPNTTYKIRTRCRRADSRLWSEAETISITTYDIAKISSVSDIEHGDNLEVTYSNPSGSSLEIGVYKMDNETPIAGYRNCSGNLYTFNFTDEELDTLYKSYGNNQELTVKVYIRTAGVASYTNIKEITITLKGNQKTANIKINGSWKRAKKWVKINGSWKRCIRWVKINGSWKRCI